MNKIGSNNTRLFILILAVGATIAMESGASHMAQTQTLGDGTVVAGTNNVSSHVLDIAVGSPAKGVACTAYKLVTTGEGRGKWELWGQTVTDSVGRIPIVHPGQPLTNGTFKLHFHTADYFRAQDRPTFYPYIEVVFQIPDPSVHYHVPITLSNFGYSTYKGQ